jgi:hypothetical protein
MFGTSVFVVTGNTAANRHVLEKERKKSILGTALGSNACMYI